MRQFRPSAVADAPHAHPLVRKLLELMRSHRCGQMDLAERIGVSQQCISDMRLRKEIKLSTLEAAFNHFGYEIVVRLRRDA